LPLPCLVVATSAVRDEGTSFQYLAPGKVAACPGRGVPLIERELAGIGWNVRSGKVWTTDAPYRETAGQLQHWAKENVLAVEMQTASLFAFGVARAAAVASIAIVSNATDHHGEQFNTGSREAGLRILKGIARADDLNFTLAAKPGELTGISHTPPPMWRRHSCLPCRDSSRHLFAAVTHCLKRSVGRSADAAGKSACATSLHPNTCEKCGLAAGLLQRSRRDDLILRGTIMRAAIKPRHLVY
jgi:hypothetical protein